MAILKRRVRKRLTERDYLKEKEKVLKLLESVTLFEGATEEDRQQRIAEAAIHFWVFCHTYLGHYFSTETQAEWHEALVDAINWIEQPAAIAAPRGFAKSTIVSFALILWCMLFSKKHFILLVMENEDKAMMQTWRILLELQYNQRILHDFGKIVSDDAARGNFTTTTGIRLSALGAGMSARGMINAQFRPDLIIMDDLETRALARNPRRVEHLLDLVLSDYLGAVCAKGWCFLIVGTIICKGSMLDTLLSEEYKTFKQLKYRAIETDEAGNERSTWPEQHPLEALYRLREHMKHSRFMAEKQNDPQDNEGQFKEKAFKYTRELPALLDRSRLIQQWDPSYSDSGDNKAGYVLASYKHNKDLPGFREWKDANGKAFPEGEYTIAIRSFNRKATIDELILKVYEFQKTWNAKEIRFDGSFGQKQMYKREFAHYEKREGFGRLPLKFTDQDRNKQEKISDLEPTVNRGFLVFLIGDTEDIKATVIQFTRFGEPGVNDDGPDAIAEGIESLKKMHKKKGRVTCA